MQRQGELSGRQALHDPRALGKSEHAYFRVPELGDAGAACTAAGQARSGGAAGSSSAPPETPARGSRLRNFNEREIPHSNEKNELPPLLLHDRKRPPPRRPEDFLSARAVLR